MALNIPLPGQPGDALLKGIDTGSQMFARLMQPIIQREQLAEQGQYHKGQLTHQQRALEEQMKQHQQDYALRQMAERRMGQNTALQRQLLQQKIMEHELKTNPKKLFKFIQGIKQQAAQNGAQMQSMPNMEPQSNEMALFEGNGMPSSEEMETPNSAQQMPQENQAQRSNQGSSLLGNLSPDEQVMLQMAGIKIPSVKENPEHKRFAELQDKLKLERFKTEQRKALEQEKMNLKNESTRAKTIQSATNDLPHLEQTLSALENMKKIATNNPDLFGHSGIAGFGAEGAAQRFANTTDNPNAGNWQTLGLGPIVAAETKMSARGNQLALKQALANKPNFSEKQPVALAKIDSSIEQIKKSIEETKKIAGTQGSGSEKSVVIINPDGKRFKTTESNAAHLPAGWKRG